MITLDWAGTAWWEGSGWVPIGYCHCGCGRRTNKPKESSRTYKHVRGIPVRFMRGHTGGRRGRDDHYLPNPSGLCWCECGQTTPIATRNNRRVGHKRGEHTRYCSGHNPGGLRGEGFLYFIGSEDSPVKVGWTNQLKRRFKEFQTAHWAELRVLGTVAGTGVLERDAHVRLREHKIRGEWFERGPALALLAELETLR